MSNEPDRRTEPTALDEHREELAAQFLRVARRESSSRRTSSTRRRLVLALGVLVLAAVPAGLAGANLLPSWGDGDVLTVDGDGNVLNDAGEKVGEVEPAVSFWGPDGLYPDCPTKVLNALPELKRAPEYANLPGYPFANCPTAEEYEGDPGVRAEFERMQADEDGASDTTDLEASGDLLGQ